jgi:hypothetical protein
MSERMQLIEEAFATISKYTSLKPWRPGLIDVYAYDIIVGMHDSDYSDLPNIDYIWNKTPDEVMEALIESPRIFDLEYGWEQFDEEIREYLIENNFITHVDEATEEEIKANLEKRVN